MQQTQQVSSIGRAFARLKVALLLCCWAVGLSIATQAVVWSLITYTDIRFSDEADKDRGAEVVQNDESRLSRLPREMRRSSKDEAAGDHHPDAEASQAGPSADPAAEQGGGPDAGDSSSENTAADEMLSRWDKRLAGVVHAAGAAGMVAALGLVPLAGLGVLLGIGAATPGVERAVSAFLAAIVLTILLLPLGGVLDVPWLVGAMPSYETMTSAVDHARGDGPAAMALEADEAEGGGLFFYVRFLGIPFTVVVVLAYIGLRFSAGIEAGLLAREIYKYDPELEKEIARIKPGSLHGGGASVGAFNRAMGVGNAGDGDSPQSSRPIPSAREVSPGEQPGRLI